MQDRDGLNDSQFQQSDTCISYGAMTDVPQLSLLSVSKSTSSNQTAKIYNKIPTASETLIITKNLDRSKKYTIHCLSKYLVFSIIILMLSVAFPPSCHGVGDHRLLFPLWIYGIGSFIISILNFYVMFKQCFKNELYATIHWLIYNILVTYYFLYVQYKVYQYKPDKNGKCQNQLVPLSDSVRFSWIDIGVIALITCWFVKFLLKLLSSIRKFDFCCGCDCMLIFRGKILNYSVRIIWAILMVLIMICLMLQDATDDRVEYPVYQAIFQWIIFLSAWDTLWIENVMQQFIKSFTCCVDKEMRRAFNSID